MKIHSYRLLPSAALLCLMLTGSKPCLAADSTTPSGYDYGSAAAGMGVNPKTGQAAANYGNTNVPFEEYMKQGTYTVNPTTGNPYDKLPIDQLNNTNLDDSGQQIYDYQAGNGAGNIPTAGEIGTYNQIPIGRSGINLATGVAGLQPTNTAIMAGAVPGAPGVHSFTTIPFEKRYKYSYGFNTSPVAQVYGGLYRRNQDNQYVPNTQNGGYLPPTSTGAVDINVANGNTLRIKASPQSNPSFSSY